MKYAYLSSREISKGIKLHITTVSGRLSVLCKSGYLSRKKTGKGFSYKFNFNSENARKLRLFLDIDFASSLHMDKVDGFIKNNRGNQNILCCILYGSSLKTKKFNDIDLLIVYEKEKTEERDIVFDIFQMDIKTFRNLYSIGEPRLQAALITGRILIDRGFIFDYFENELPIRTSEDIIYELQKKYNVYLKSIQTMKKPGKEELRKAILDLLQTKAVIEFVSRRVVVPVKTDFQKELEKINPQLNNLISKTNSAEGAKELFDLFYAEILGL